MERRRRIRAQVHWPLSFTHLATNGIVTSTTHDLSSDGFYCLVNCRFVPGEITECILTVPTHHPRGCRPTLPVICRVRIVRAEIVGESGPYGVGCAIEDYRFAGPEAGRHFWLSESYSEEPRIL